MTATRFPLAWPSGWRRTPRADRRRAKFTATGQQFNGTTAYRVRRQLTAADAIERLSGEMRRLGVIDGDWLISSNVELRLDGLPYANRAQPDDCGVAVYFRLKKQDRVLACDSWDRYANHIAAVAAHIECIRAIDRYGVGTLEQAFAGYKALPAKGGRRTTLGFAVDQTVTVAMIEAAFRERAKLAHPDKQGGSHDAMASLTAAKADGLFELKASEGTFA